MATPLLTTNTKLSKGDKYHVLGLAIPPASLSGRNVCAFATSCVKSCLGEYAGRQVMPSVREANQRRADLLFSDPPAFRARLLDEIGKAQRKHGDQLLVRLNVFSDLDWRTVVNEASDTRFYDYTKALTRWANPDWPTNYALTYSWNENSRKRESAVARGLKLGRNVSVVFNTEWRPSVGQIGPLPAYFRIGRDYWPIVDGDKHDYRIPAEDGCGKVIGLRLKGTNAARRAAVQSGFAVNPDGKRCQI